MSGTQSRRLPVTVELIADQLGRWASVHRPGATVGNVRAMPGNAGLSFGFDLDQPDAGALSLVIRLAPPGVRRSGNTDVLRQVPLLDELQAAAGFPTAKVHWSASEDEVFGTDAFMVEMLVGKPLHMTSADLSCDIGPEGPGPLLDLAVDALVGLHEMPVTPRLAAWERPTSLSEDVEGILSLIGRAGDSWLVDHGGQLARELGSRVPQTPDVGVRHGDFQTNNILYESGRLTGVVDWELAGLGSQLSDLTWLVMMTDPSCWEDDYGRRLRATTKPSELVERYASRGRSVDDLPWFLALTCLRFSAIVCYNLRLHLDGKRVDPYFEELRRSVPRLIDRGRRALAQDEV